MFDNNTPRSRYFNVLAASGHIRRLGTGAIRDSIPFTDQQDGGRGDAFRQG